MENWKQHKRLQEFYTPFPSHITALYPLSNIRSSRLPKTGRLPPDPSIVKSWPHSNPDDEFENLRLHSGECVADDYTRPSVCTKRETKLSCTGPRRSSTGEIVRCDFVKPPVLLDDFLEHQNCVTRIPGNIQQHLTADMLEPKPCSTALADPNRRLNVVEIPVLTLTNPGSGYTNSTNALRYTSSTSHGVDLQLSVDIRNGSVVRFQIADPGHGYDVGDVVTLNGGDGNATWKITDKNVFLSALPYGSTYATVQRPDDNPEEIIRFLYNPIGLSESDDRKAFDNACKFACTNGRSDCERNCHRNERV